MVQLKLTTRDNQTHIIETEGGRSLMEVIIEAGFDELCALCGGCLSCATCHVYVDDNDIERLDEIQDDERMMLEALEHSSDKSRLSCQIPFHAGLDGLHVTVAPDE